MVKISGLFAVISRVSEESAIQRGILQDPAELNIWSYIYGVIYLEVNVWSQIPGVEMSGVKTLELSLPAFSEILNDPAEKNMWSYMSGVKYLELSLPAFSESCKPRLILCRVLYSAASYTLPRLILG